MLPVKNNSDAWSARICKLLCALGVMFGLAARSLPGAPLGPLQTANDSDWRFTLPLPPTATPLSLGAQPSKPKPSGLTLTFDSRWAGACGYRPVRLTVAQTIPNSTPRLLTIRVRAVGGFAVAQQIEVPAGTTAATSLLSLPQLDWRNTMLLDVFDSGKRIDELSFPSDVNESRMSWVISQHSNSSGSGRSTASIMALGLDATEGGALLSTFGTATTCSFVFADLHGGSSIQSVTPPVSPSELPFLANRWIDNSGIDYFLLSLDEAASLSRNHAAEWAAARSAVAAGATMCVVGFDKDWERLDNLETLMGFPAPAPAAKTKAQASPAVRGWREPDAAFLVEPNQKSVPNPGMLGDRISEPGDESPAAQNTPKTAAPDKAVDANFLPCLIHPLMRGRVVAIASSEPSAYSALLSQQLIDSEGASKWQWPARHGVVLDPDSVSLNRSDFWEFTIPGVGLTPITEFQVLISLFVLAIGPLNYWLLRRWHRQNLLILTVPLTAATATGLLLLYAMLADGLGVRTRIRSFTEIDCRRGEAVCWSRLSYYAGVSPSRGLEFPGDVAVYPFLQDSRDQWRSDSARQIIWQPPTESAAGGSPSDELPVQRWSKEWLPSRTPTQFITVRSRKTAAQVGVRRGDGRGRQAQSYQSAGNPHPENRCGGRSGKLFSGGRNHRQRHCSARRGPGRCRTRSHPQSAQRKRPPIAPRVATGLVRPVELDWPFRLSPALYLPRHIHIRESEGIAHAIGAAARGDPREELERMGRPSGAAQLRGDRRSFAGSRRRAGIGPGRGGLSHGRRTLVNRPIGAP